MRLLFFLLLFAYLWPMPVDAAFRSSADSQAPELAFNPVPLQDDIILPMPCGLQLILRAVHVPGHNLLQDRAFTMGVSSQQAGRGFYEGQFTGHIAAPFTMSNLPESWRQKLAGQGDSGSWYFIGKYEISHLQWDAVMDALDSAGNENSHLCPLPGKGMRQPVTNVSWFDVQNFLNRYNAWLIKKHRADLPAWPGTQNMAFLRLPTEEEWEFAARGGDHVPPEWWADKDFFPQAEGHKISDYGIYNTGTALSAPGPIGSRLANPLGLHDTAGNAREMIDGFFRMSIPEMRNGQIERRLHGASGGLLSKGGGFRSLEEAVLPGARDETPLFTANGAAFASDLGFRVALAGINVPDAERMKELRKDVEKSAQTLEANIEPDLAAENFTNPLEAVRAMLKVVNNPLHPGLEKLHSMLEEQEQAQTRADAENLERAFRGLLYQAETLRSYAYRYAAAIKLRDQLKAILAGNVSASDREKAEKGLQLANEDLKDYLSSLEMGASYYKNGLERLAGQPYGNIASLVRQARTEYGGEGVFNEHMRHNAEILDNFLKDGSNAHKAKIQTILQAILPEAHYKLLPHG